MRWIPEQKNRRLVQTVLGVLFGLGAVLYAIPPVCRARGISVMPFPFTFLTLLCVVGAIFFLVRYLMTGFTYLIRMRSGVDTDPAMEAAMEGNGDITRISPDFLDFVVLKAQGNRAAVMECVLPLGDLTAVIPIARKPGQGLQTPQEVRQDYIRTAGYTAGFVFYDYTLTFRWEQALELVFIDGNRYVGVMLEAEGPFAAYLRQLKPGGEHRSL